MGHTGKDAGLLELKANVQRTRAVHSSVSRRCGSGKQQEGIKRGDRTDPGIKKPFMHSLAGHGKRVTKGH